MPKTAQPIGLALLISACGAGGSTSAPAAASAQVLAPELGAMADALAAVARKAAKRRIAVVGLSTVGSDSPVLGEFVAEKLVTRLAQNTDELQLIERGKLKAVVEEQAFTLSGLSDPAQSMKLGELLAAEALILGTVTVLESQVDVNARLVDAQTAQILGSAETQLDRASLRTHIPPDVPVAAAAPLTMSSMFLGERKVGEHYEEIVIRDGQSLRSGDGLKLAIEVNRKAHVYAIILDSTGTASLIFPSEEMGTSNPLAGGRPIEIPAGDQWFFLDDNTGTETIYVLASLEPLPAVGELLVQLEKLAKDRDAATIDAQVAGFVGAKGPVTRGIGGIKKGAKARVQKSDGRFFERSQELLTGTGSVVRAVSFRHE